MQKKNIEILGYFKRVHDGNEYILFKKNGELYITSGVHIWNNQYKRIEKRYLPQLEKTVQIDHEKMVKRLKKNYQYAEITVGELKVLTALLDKPLS